MFSGYFTAQNVGTYIKIISFHDFAFAIPALYRFGFSLRIVFGLIRHSFEVNLVVARFPKLLC